MKHKLVIVKLLVILIAIPLYACASPFLQSNLNGVWEGSVEMPGILKKHVIIRFSTTGKNLSGTLDVPTSRTFGFALRDLRLSERNVSFTLPLGESGKLQFDGRIEKDTIKGGVSGAGLPGTFSLKLSNKESKVSPPNQFERKKRDYFPTTEWKTSEPQAHGIDPKRLGDAEKFVLEKLPEVRSLLVVRNGKLVYEKYFRGATAKDAFNIKSVTKSFTSALIGIALRDGVLRTTDEKLPDLLPDYFNSETDSRKKQITLRHLLTMTAGFDWRENEQITARWLQSPNYVKFTLDLPLAAEPGKVQNYNTGLSHLLSAIITEKSKTNALDFARKHLCEPIGIRIGRWDTAPEGFYEGGSEMYLTARDMARFGFLYLNVGEWEGRQIVPAEWVRESTSPQTGKDPLWADYGYQWWVGGDDDTPSFSALGYGGQAIHVVPKLDLVVVVTSTVNDARNPVTMLISEYVVPAVIEQEKR
ncbi:MAG: serine hydrolase [Acidobacteriota bacterium]